LLPTLLGNQPLPSAVPQPAELFSGATAALQLPLLVAADAALLSDLDSALSAFLSSLAPSASAAAESSS
jgi:hypothetical protein